MVPGIGGLYVRQLISWTSR